MTLAASAERDVGRLTQAFLEQVYRLPDGEKIKTCIQCGACSGSCPVSSAMDYSPRAVFAALRAERLDRVLSSNTMWLCASCYACAVRCPAGISITDVMYGLKRLAVQHRLVRDSDARKAALARSLVETVDRAGRNAEVEFLVRYFLKLRGSPGEVTGGPLRMLPLGLRLFRKGRLTLRSDRVADGAGLRRIMEQAAVEEARLAGEAPPTSIPPMLLGPGEAGEVRE